MCRETFITESKKRRRKGGEKSVSSAFNLYYIHDCKGKYEKQLMFCNESRKKEAN